MYDENSLEYKVEKVYTSHFSIKKFKKMVLECKKEQIIGHLKFYTQGGCLGAGTGWSEDNHTILWIDKRGVIFNNDESHIYSFEEIADLLIAQYGQYKQMTIFE